MMDPRENSTTAFDIPTREDKSKVPSRFPPPNRPSLHWGNEHLWANPPYDPADPHNPMIDSKVDLPAPDGPIMVTNAPSSMSSVICRKI